MSNRCTGSDTLSVRDRLILCTVEVVMAGRCASSDHNAIKVFHWIRWGNADYLAARSLLLEGMLVQGSGLANTAIEKYLKGLCANVGLPIPRSHRIAVIYGTVKKHIRSSLVLNEGFLRFLEKAYTMRYPDELEDGFNVALNQMKISAELDRTIHLIREQFVLNDADRDDVLQLKALSANPRYAEKNAALEPSQCAAFFAAPSRSFEYRVYGPAFIEAPYLSPYCLDDGNFDIEGVKPKGKQLVLAFPHRNIKNIQRILC